MSSPSDMVIDQSDNVYVTGVTHFGDNDSKDWVTIKYDPNGNEQWVMAYNGPGNSQDESASIAIDSFGDIYVTGFSWDSLTGFDYTTIKYSSDGEQVWNKRYDGPGAGGDKASDILVDSNNDVFITGTSAGLGTFEDFVTIKYNSEGIEQWVARYNGTADSTDRAIAIDVDSNGNVIVAGYSFDNGTQDDYVVVKYNPDGVEQWVARYNGTANSTDILRALYLDNSSNVYVTGSSFGPTNTPDFATVKYNSSGVKQWEARYNGPSDKGDVARALTVGISGDVFVTGSSFSNDTGNDYATIKYNIDGEQQWVATYNGPILHPFGTDPPNDVARDIEVDNSNSVYVTGSNYDILAFASNIETIKYGSDGEVIWISTEQFSSRNWVNDLEVDDLSNIYMVYAYEGLTFSAIATVKYDQEIVAIKNEGIIPEKYHLSQNYPNPFNPETTIEYTLPQSGNVSLIIYNLLGEEVALLIDNNIAAGNHRVTWNASNFSSGIYFYRLRVDDFVQTRKMVLLK